MHRNAEKSRAMKRDVKKCREIKKNAEKCREIYSAICLGAQSFEHANVLSEKINFSALGGPGVAIFGPDDLHPMC